MLLLEQFLRIITPTPTDDTRVMTLAQARRYALSLPGTREEPHFERTSFRVGGKIFATAKPDDGHLNVFVGDEHREPALASHPEYMEKLMWGGKAVGLRISLAEASPAVVKDLLLAGLARKGAKIIEEGRVTYERGRGVHRGIRSPSPFEAAMDASGTPHRGILVPDSVAIHGAGHHPPQHQGAQRVGGNPEYGYRRLSRNHHPAVPRRDSGAYRRAS